MNIKTNIRTNFGSIFILPYLCGFSFLFFYFKESNTSCLYPCISICIYSFVCFITTFASRKKQKNLWSGQVCDFTLKSFKSIKIITVFFVFTCMLMLIANLLTSSVSMTVMAKTFFALVFSLFPQSLIMFSNLCITNAASSLSSFGIKIKSPNAISAVNESKILIIDEFDRFSNPELIFELTVSQNIILVSKKSEAKIKSQFNKYIFNAAICHADRGEIPFFSKEISIAVYPEASIHSVVSVINKLNKPFSVVSPYETNGLHLKITSNIKSDADIYLPESNTSSLLTLQKNCIKAFKSYRKCFIYILSLSVAKLISFFVCMFLCGSFPFLPLMLIFSTMICDFFPPLSFIYDKADYVSEKTCTSADDLVQIILDGCLIAVVIFIVYMAASIGFQDSCARLIAFHTCVISSLLYAFNMRSDKSVFLIGLLTNRITNFAFFTGISASIIITAFLYTDISDFGAAGWILILSMSIIPFAVTQLQKAAVTVFRR